jgi:hypothetical protein
MGYLTINTRSNRVEIISSVITRIFLSSVQCLDGHISTYFNKDTCDLFMLCMVLMCQLYRAVFIIVVRLFCSLFNFYSSFVQLLFSFVFDSFTFHRSMFVVQKKIFNSDPDCIPGISIRFKYPLYMKYLFIIIYASQ